MISLGSCAASPVRTSAVLTCSWMAFLCLQSFYGGVLPAAWVICSALFLFSTGIWVRCTCDCQLPIVRAASAQIALTFNGESVRKGGQQTRATNERTELNWTELLRSHISVSLWFFCTTAIISNPFVRSPFLLGETSHFGDTVGNILANLSIYLASERYSPSTSPCKLLTNVPAHYLFPVLCSTLQWANKNQCSHQVVNACYFTAGLFVFPPQVTALSIFRCVPSHLDLTLLFSLSLCLVFFSFFF